MLAKLITKNQTSVEFIKYSAMGAVTFLIDFMVLVTLTERFNVHYLTAAVCGFLVGVLINYTVSITCIFSMRQIHNAYIEFSIFILVGCVGLGIHQFVLWSITEHLNVFYMYSKCIATGVTLIWNFTARKKLLF